jgi:hypothetical protein
MVHQIFIDKKNKMIRLFLSLVWSLNYYEGVDKPTFWQWLYAWRVKPSTAWKVSKILRK